MSKRFISILNFTYRYTMRKTLQKKKKKKKKKNQQQQQQQKPPVEGFFSERNFYYKPENGFLCNSWYMLQNLQSWNWAKYNRNILFWFRMTIQQISVIGRS